VDKSLLLQDETGGAEPRFRMLETVREFALEQQEVRGEAETARQAHAAYFLSLAEEAEPKLFGADAGRWFNRLEADHDNLRAALQWTIDTGAPVTALRLGGALWQFWYVRGHLTEGRRWLKQALTAGGLADDNSAAIAARTDVPARVAARALNGAGVLAHYQGDYGRAAMLCGASLSIARRHSDKAGVAAALNGLAVVARSGGEFATAAAMYREAIAILKELDDRAGLTHTLRYLGVLLWAQRDVDAAREPVEQALALAEAAGDKQHAAGALGVLGYLRHERGEYDAAEGLLDESLRLYSEIRDRRGVARALWGLGRTAAAMGNPRQAYRRFRESAALFKELGDYLFAGTCLDGLAGVALALQRPELAARLLGAAQSLLEGISAARNPTTGADYERYVAGARAALGDAALADAFASGRCMPLAEALAAAATLSEPAPAAPLAPPPAALAPTSRPRNATAPLTAREREVAELIARGLTDKQIAAELIIAEGTASRHVSNILGKLGFVTRTQVAAWVAGQQS
jgi:ATP/maltotriose-dependent transcriptional regulator MalT